MRLIFALPIIAITSAMAGESLSIQGVDVSISLPEGWKIRSEGIRSAMYPPVNLHQGKLQRRIHIVMAHEQSGSLEDAMNSDIDTVTKRAPSWGSGNDRRHFLGAAPVRLASGLEGIGAEFGYGEGEARKYTINKFYFRNHDGQIFIVCAHVYGDQHVADEFKKIILERIMINEVHKGRPR